MKITPTKIKEVFILEPNTFNDHRGWFMESYNRKTLQEHGIDINFVQDNHSFTIKKGSLRGLHFQNNPYSQTKLVRCTKGAVLDVAVDLRKDSPTFKEWVSVELTDENKKQFLVPKGFAHGFMSLSDEAEVEYKIDEYYNKDADRNIRFDDPEINVDWRGVIPILSEKDTNAPLLKDSDVNF